MTDLRTSARGGLRPLAVIATLLGLSGSGCVEAQETVDVVVHHAMSVDFGAMEADTVEQAVVLLPDLREEPDFLAYQSQLVCGALAHDASWMQLTALDATSLGATLSLELQVRARDSEEPWAPLVNYAGTLTVGEVIPLDGAGIAHFPQGEDVLIDTSLSSQPAYDIRVVGEAAEALESLRIGLELEIAFSSTSTGCP